MNNDRYMYVFVRQDFPIEEQLVSVGHVCGEVGREEGENFGNPYLVLIGMPNLNALNRVMTKLNLNNIIYAKWIDTDLSPDVRAIATIPLDESKREVLASYRVYRFNQISPSSSEKEHLAIRS